MQKILVGLVLNNWAHSVGVLLLEDDNKPGGKKPGGKKLFAVLRTENGIQDVKYECGVEYGRLWAAYIKQTHKWMQFSWARLDENMESAVQSWG